MNPCIKCGVKFDYVEGINHRCYTTSEWKKFATNPVQAETNEFQFVNFFTQQKESYDYITTAEVLLARHVIIIINHTNRKRIGTFAKTPMKEKLKGGLKSLPSKITQKNFNKGMKIFDESMQGLTKSLDQLGDGLGGKKDNKSKMEKLWGVPKSTNTDKIWGSVKKKSSKSNMDKIWGTPSKKKSSSVKIWGDSVQPKRKKTRKKTKSDEWDNREAIWGKSKKFKL